MKTLRSIVLILSVCLFCIPSNAEKPQRYFYLNASFQTYNYEKINELFGPQGEQETAVGNAILIYIFEKPLQEFVSSLEKHFALAEKYDIPVIVELDPITFWDSVPELWNWWDPDKPGYNPANRENVEWTSWSSDDAVKIGWLNWGCQVRLKPMANLFAPAYQAAVRERMTTLIDLTYSWYKSLPKGKKYLLGGIKITGELGFGMNNWVYHNPNDYYDKPEKDDPKTGLKEGVMPFRGVGPIGYASLKYSGIRTEGEITPDDIFRLEWLYAKYIADLCQNRGFPREMLFSHSGGWGDDMMAAVQENTCPSWSFYWGQAMEPRKTDHMKYLALSDAPYWGMSEWNIGTDSYDKWMEALENCFAIPRLRFISVFNYDSVFKADGTVKEGVVKALLDFQKK